MNNASTEMTTMNEEMTENEITENEEE